MCRKRGFVEVIIASFVVALMCLFSLVTDLHGLVPVKQREGSVRSRPTASQMLVHTSTDHTERGRRWHKISCERLTVQYTVRKIIIICHPDLHVSSVALSVQGTDIIYVDISNAKKTLTVRGPRQSTLVVVLIATEHVARTRNSYVSNAAGTKTRGSPKTFVQYKNR